MRLAHALDAGRPPERPEAVEDCYADLPAGPSLSTDVSADGGTVTVLGETDGARVVVSGPENRATPALEDGSFSATLSLLDEDGDGDESNDGSEDDEGPRVTVVAVTEGD